MNKIEKTSLLVVFMFLGALAISFTRNSIPKNASSDIAKLKPENKSVLDTTKSQFSFLKETPQRNNSESDSRDLKLPRGAKTDSKSTSVDGIVKEDTIPQAKKPATKPGIQIQDSQQVKDTGKFVYVFPVITTRILGGKNDSVLVDSGPTHTRAYFSRSNPAIASIILDLKNEGLIKDEGEKFTWLLSNEKLLVNGVRQPIEIHMKILWKYITPIEHINIYYECCR